MCLFGSIFSKRQKKKKKVSWIFQENFIKKNVKRRVTILIYVFSKSFIKVSTYHHYYMCKNKLSIVLVKIIKSLENFKYEKFITESHGPYTEKIWISRIQSEYRTSNKK